jgi:hypothetical protein
MKGPFSALRPFAISYPIRTYACLLGFFIIVESIAHRAELFDSEFNGSVVGEIVGMSMFFAIGFFVFIRYVTRFISSSSDE